MKEELAVVAALFVEGGRVFLARRRASVSHGGLWELPGGKLEAGESPQSALVREIREELGVGLSCLQGARSYSALVDGQAFAFHVLPSTIEGGKLSLTAHDDFGWFDAASIPWASLAPLDGEPLRDWVSGRFAPEAAAPAPRGSGA